MASVGSVELTLTLNRAQFDKQLRSLSTQKLTSINLGIKFDGKSLEKQVKSLNNSLELDCLQIELCPDIKGFERKLKDLPKSLIDCIDICLEPDFVDFDRKLKKGLDSKKYSTDIGLDTGGFKDNIEGAFTDALRRVQGGGTFSKLGGIVTAPLKGAIGSLAPIFLGLGTAIAFPLGTQIGTGLTKGLQSKFGTVIGSFELIGDTAGRLIGGGVESGFTSAIASTKANAPQIVKILEKSLGEKQLTRLFGASYRTAITQAIQSASPGKAITQALGSEDVLLESRSARGKSNKTRVARRNEATAQLEVEQKASAGTLAGLNKSAAALDATAANFLNDYRSRVDTLTEAEVRQFNLTSKTIEQRRTALQKQISSIQSRKVEAETGLQTLGKVKPVTSPTQNVPKLYSDVAKEVAALSGIKNISANSIPKLQVDEKLRPGAFGTYDSKLNQINVSKEAHEALVAAKVDFQTIETLVHELRHAVQFGFGKVDVAGTNKAALPLEKATPAEIQKLGRRVESSVEIQPSSKQDITRRLETDAYVFAERNAKSVQEKLAKSQAIKGFESNLGLGGSKIDLQLKRAQTAELKKIQQINSVAQSFGVDLQAEIARSLKAFTVIEAQFNPLLAKARNIEALPAHEILAIQKEIQLELTTALADVARQSETIKTALINKKSVAARVVPPQVSEDLSIRVNQLTRAQLNPVAKKLGISSKDKKTDALRAEILKASKSDLESALPTVVAEISSAVKQQADAVSKLSLDALRQRAKEVNQIIKIGIAKAESQTGTEKTSAFKQVLDGINKERSLLKETLTREISDDTRNYIKSSIATLGKSQRKAQTEYGRLVAQQSQASKNNAGTPRVDNLSQGNSFDELASFEDVVKALNEARDKLFNSFSRNTAKSVKNTSVDPVVQAELDRLKTQTSSLKDKVLKLKSPDIQTANTNPNILKLEESLKELDSLIKQIDTQKSVQLNELVKSTASEIASLKQFNKSASRKIRTSSRTVDTSLASIGKQTDVELNNLEISRQNKINRLENRISKKYGFPSSGGATLDTEVKPLNINTEIKSIGGAIKNLFKGVQQTRISAAKKQADILTQSANILLTDIESQVTLGKTAENEAKVLNRQIVANEKKINQILAAIKRANTGSAPALTLGDKQRAAGEVEKLNAQIDADKQSLAAGRLRQAKGKELEPVAQNLRRSITGTTNTQDLKQLQQFNSEIRNTFKVLGQEPPTNLFSSISDLIGGLDERSRGLVGGLGNLVKGFIAFQGVFFVQNLLSSFARGAADSVIALDKLTTTLNFASGSAAAGSRNLAFVREEVERLKIPLAQSQQGFVSLAAATRGGALEGKATQDIFKGVSEASTVLSLSAEDTAGIYTALSQVASKGKVQAEELRGQLGERIPGAFQIAARAMGVTEAELNKLLETGQVVSEDFLPRFARQLQTEFGEAAVNASGNATSAVFNLQNQTLKLQETFGKAIQPAFVLGLNATSGAMKFLADNALLATGIFTGLAIVIAKPLLGPIFKLLGSMPLIEAGIAGIKGAIAALRATMVPLLVTFTSIAVALEAFKIGDQLINGGPLTRQFDELVAASKNAVKAFGDAKTEISEIASTRLPSANFIDDIINTFEGIDRLIVERSNLSPEAKKKKLQELEDNRLTTYADLDRDRAISVLSGSGKDLSAAADAAMKEVADSKAGKTNLSLLPKIEVDIQAIANQRKVLQGRIAREFTNKGLQVPAELKISSEELNSQYNALVNKQSDFSKGGVEQYNALKKSIDGTKSTLKSLSDPAVIKQFGGEQFVAPLRKELEAVIAKAEPAQIALADLLAATKADPILALTAAFRKLNKELQNANEQSTIKFAVTKEGIAKDQLGAFTSDIFASRRAALATANAERDRIDSELKAAEDAITGKQAAINDSSFRPVLSRFGLTSVSSAADIQNAIDLPSTTEDDKKILEQIKTVKDAEINLHNLRTSFYEAGQKQQTERQAFALDSINEVTNQTALGIQRAESARTIAVKKGISDRTITEEQGAIELAKIQYGTTALQQQSVSAQLKNLRNYQRLGIIGAEVFHNEERKLLTQQSSYRRQLSEQEIAYVESVRQKRIADVEEVAAREQAAIDRTKNARLNAIKEQRLAGKLTPDQASAQTTAAEIQSTRSGIALAKTRFTTTKQLRTEGVLSAKEAAAKEREIIASIAQHEGQILDLRLTQQQQARERSLRILEDANRRAIALIDNSQLQADIAVKRGALNLPLNEDSDRSVSSRLEENQAAATRARITQAQTELKQLSRANFETDADYTNKRIELESNLGNLIKQNLDEQLGLAKRNLDDAVIGINRRVEGEKVRGDLAIQNLEDEKTALDLFNASLDRSKQLLESRSSVSKAISDAAITQGEGEIALLDQALQIRQKLNDENLTDAQKSAYSGLLSQLGGGSTELDILARRQQLEDSVAQKRQAALVAEQKLARDLLDIDLQRQRATAQTAIFEAEIARDRALIARLEAVGQLNEAEVKQDDRLVNLAKQRLDLQDRIVASTDKQLANAEANLDIQDELAKNSLAALDAQQKGALESAASAEKLRNVSQDLLKIDTKYKSTEEKKENKGIERQEQLSPDIKPTITTSEKPQYKFKSLLQKRSYEMLGIVPGESAYQAVKRQLFGVGKKKKRDASNPGGYRQDALIASEELQALADIPFASSIPDLKITSGGAPDQSGSIGLNRATSVEAQLNAMLGLKPLGEELQKSTEAAVKPETSGFTAFTEGLKAANTGIEQRLDTLNKTMSNAINSPRSLYVSSPNPVTDAAKIMSDVTRQSVLGAGLG